MMMDRAQLNARFNLPEGWYAEFDRSTRRVYFWNVYTKERTWTEPSRSDVRNRGPRASLAGLHFSQNGASADASAAKSGTSSSSNSSLRHNLASVSASASASVMNVSSTSTSTSTSTSGNNNNNNNNNNISSGINPQNPSTSGTANINLGNSEHQHTYVDTARPSARACSGSTRSFASDSGASNRSSSPMSTSGMVSTQPTEILRPGLPSSNSNKHSNKIIHGTGVDKGHLTTSASSPSTKANLSSISAASRVSNMLAAQKSSRSSALASAHGAAGKLSSSMSSDNQTGPSTSHMDAGSKGLQAGESDVVTLQPNVDSWAHNVNHGFPSKGHGAYISSGSASSSSSSSSGSSASSASSSPMLHATDMMRDEHRINHRTAGSPEIRPSSLSQMDLSDDINPHVEQGRSTVDPGEPTNKRQRATTDPPADAKACVSLATGSEIASSSRTNQVSTGSVDAKVPSNVEIQRSDSQTSIGSSVSNSSGSSPMRMLSRKRSNGLEVASPPANGDLTLGKSARMNKLKGLMSMIGKKTSFSRDKKRREGVITESSTSIDNGKDIAVVPKFYPKSEKVRQLLMGIIKDQYLFQALPHDLLHNLVSMMCKEEVVQGHVLIREGDRGDFFYVVEVGTFDVLQKRRKDSSHSTGARNSAHASSSSSTTATPSQPTHNTTAYAAGNTNCHEDSFTPEFGRKVGKIEAGGSFGELALLYGQKRAATVQASSNAIVWKLDRVGFRSMVQASTRHDIQEAKAALKSVPLLSALTDEQMDRCAEVVRYREYQKGAQIIRKGEIGDVFYIISSGEVEVSDGMVLGADMPHPLVKLGAHACFGERALLKDEARAANVIALTDVRCLVLDRHAFNTILGPLREVLDNNIRDSIFKQIELFRCLDMAEVEKVFSAFTLQSFEKGEFIIRQGEEANSFYVLRSGEADVTQDVQLEVNKMMTNQVSTLKVGDYFGEMALAEGNVREANVIARTPCECFVLDRESFEGLLGPADAILKRVIKKRRQENALKKRAIQAQHQQEMEAAARAAQVAAAAHAQNAQAMRTCTEADMPQFAMNDEMREDLLRKQAAILEQQQRLLHQHHLLQQQIHQKQLLQQQRCQQDQDAMAQESSQGQKMWNEQVMEGASGAAHRPETNGKLARGSEHTVSDSESTCTSAMDVEVAAQPSIPPPPIDSPTSQQTNYTFRDLQPIKTLGTGTFGRVQMVRHFASGSTYALKVQSKAQITRYKLQQNILNEKIILSSLRHPFIITLHQTFQDRDCLYMLLELVQGGELFSFLQNYGANLQPLHHKFYMACVVSSFSYLHSRDILYRDLKPENILIDTDGYLKLVDFGFAKHERNKAFTTCGTPDYFSPELVLGRGYGKGNDHWGIGILMYEVISGYTPFSGPDDNQNEVCKRIVKQPLIFPEDCQDIEAKRLIAGLLKKDPLKRLGGGVRGVAEIMAHPWFRQVNWKHLETKQIQAPWKPPIRSDVDCSMFDDYDENFKVLPYLESGPAAAWADSF